MGSGSLRRHRRHAGHAGGAHHAGSAGFFRIGAAVGWDGRAGRLEHGRGGRRGLWAAGPRSTASGRAEFGHRADPGRADRATGCRPRVGSGSVRPRAAHRRDCRVDSHVVRPCAGGHRAAGPGRPGAVRAAAGAGRVHEWCGPAHRHRTAATAAWPQRWHACGNLAGCLASAARRVGLADRGHRRWDDTPLAARACGPGGFAAGDCCLPPAACCLAGCACRPDCGAAARWPADSGSVVALVRRRRARPFASARRRSCRRGAGIGLGGRHGIGAQHAGPGPRPQHRARAWP